MTKIKLIKYHFLFLLAIITIWQWGQAATIYSKAYLAKWLIKKAWENTLDSHQTNKPWPWADTWPVAKILLPKGKNFYVLSGSTGNSLAFGPGHVSNTALPGQSGTSIIGGHRDTHFRALHSIQEDDQIQIQNMKGQWSSYSVEKMWVASSQRQPLFIDPQLDELYLITCYPFNGLVPGGEKRFIVNAVKN